MHALLKLYLALALFQLSTNVSAAESASVLANLQPQAIIGPNALEYIEAAAGTELYTYAQIVSRVENTSGSGTCTGFRVGQTLFMTNNHCVQPCAAMIFRSGYERDIPRTEQPGFKCKALITTLQKYDYALYRVETDEGADDFPIATLSRAPVSMAQPLLTPGHPSTRHKMFDRSAQCKVSHTGPVGSASRTSFGHTCDTEQGSSGSPIIDRANGYVVGIHWGSAGTQNAGIPMHLVLDHITSTAPQVVDELTIAD